MVFIIGLHLDLHCVVFQDGFQSCFGVGAVGLVQFGRIDTGKANLVQLFGGIFPHVDGITIDDGDHFTGVGGDGAVADGGADEDEEGEGDGYQNGWFVVHGVLLSCILEIGKGCSVYI